MVGISAKIRKLSGKAAIPRQRDGLHRLSRTLYCASCRSAWEFAAFWAIRQKVRCQGVFDSAGWMEMLSYIYNQSIV
jgi:hypothetical protein